MGWVVGGLVGWVGGLVGWWVGGLSWLVGWLAGWLVGSLVGWLAARRFWVLFQILDFQNFLTDALLILSRSSTCLRPFCSILSFWLGEGRRLL